MELPAIAAPAVVVPTQEGYDQWSVIYDAEDNPLIALEEREIPALLPARRGLDVADIGCGTGRHTVRLARAGHRVTAVDFSAGMLAHARRKLAELGGSSAELHVHDLGQPLPFAARSFDLVLSCLVIEHIRDLDLYFRELGRICRTDGSIVISAMHPAMMLLGVSARFTKPDTGEKVAPESHPQTLSDYVMAATRAGLRFTHLSEHRVDESIRQASPRSARYLGWPMLLLMRLSPIAAGAASVNE